MARRNGSRSRPRHDVVRIYKTEEIGGSKSGGSIFSCVANTSDTGSYEIEICERQSVDYASSRLSNDSEFSKSSIGRSSTRPNVLSLTVSPARSKNRLMQSYYPCLCSANDDRSRSRVVVADKDTSAVVETVDRAQSCEEDKSVRGEEKGKCEPKTDSENCSCSTCNSSTTMTTKTENSTDESDSGDSGNSASGESSAVDRNPPAPEPSGNRPDGEKGKTTVVLELIREEEERQSLKTKNCNCEMNNYDERLKKLESLHLSDQTVEDEEGIRQQYCDCTTTILNFAEINYRIDALERLYRNSVGKKNVTADGKMESTESDADALRKDKQGDNVLMPEVLDDKMRTAIELAKIKKRLVDLEAKILSEKIHKNESKDKSLEDFSRPNRDRKKFGKTAKTYLAQVRTKFLDKETQAIESEDKNSGGKPWKEERWAIANETETATFYLSENTDPWTRIALKDECIQTPSRKQMDRWSADGEADSTGRRFRSKKSCDRIHLCRDCGYYVTQKVGAARSRGSGQSDENFTDEREKCSSENFNRIKKSLAAHPINASAGRKSHSRENKRFDSAKSKKSRKKLKLCTKCPVMNLMEGVAYNCETNIGPSLISSEDIDCWRSNSVELKPRVCLPRESLRVYHTRETMRHLLFVGKTPPNERFLSDRLHRFAGSVQDAAARPNDSRSVDSSFAGKVKIPALFEEIRNSNRSLTRSSSVSEDGGHGGNPLRKILRKLSHDRSEEKKSDGDAAKVKKEKSRPLHLTSLFKKSWI